MRDVLDGVRVSQRSIDDCQLSQLLTHPVVLLVWDVNCIVNDFLYLNIPISERNIVQQLCTK